jgi:hypothetical protein
MRYIFILIILALGVIVKAQTYEGIWHLGKKIEGNDTIRFDININKGTIEELDFFLKKTNYTSKDFMIEDSIQFVSIGIQSTIEKGINIEEEYESLSCPCFVYQSVVEKYLFFQLCESRREFLYAELKNQELHLTTLKKFDWQKKEYKKSSTREVYVYIKN